MSFENVVKISQMDLQLVGNPQITFFKSVYRRHTPFFKGIYSYTKNENVLDTGVFEQKISYGTFDLMCDIFIEHRIKDLDKGEKIYANIGNSVINSIQLNVGQTTVFNTYGLYMEARSEIDHPYIPSMLSGSSVPPILNGSLSCVTGNIYNISSFAGGVSGSLANDSDTDIFYTYPNFYFCQDYGSSFPICALNNSITNLVINYRNINEFTSSTSAKLEATINVEYVNLSSDERMRFINNTEEYLYYNIKPIPLSSQNTAIFEFNNSPIRQMFFVGNNRTETNSETVSPSTPTSLSALTNTINIYADSSNNTITESSDVELFTKRNLYKLYKGYGRDLVVTADGKSHGYLDSVGVYSFCLDTTNMPSGHCSSNVNLYVELGNSFITNNSNNFYLYLEQINFYRIMGGQLSTLYING